MKIISRNKLSQLFSVAFFYLFANALNTQAEGVDFSVGASTNGIYAFGRYVPDWPDHGHAIRVFIHFGLPSTNIETISAFPTTIRLTNGVEVGQEPISVGKYFMPTNSFTGCIELQNAEGDMIPLLKPEVNFTEAYPASYSLRMASKFLAGSIGASSPLPGVLSGTDPEQCCFRLPNYFKIEKPGDYRLTIWPKIYKRSETNHDLVNRIDLPPVTVPIKWTAGSTN